MSADGYLSPRSYAAYIDCSAKTARKDFASGKFPVVRDGRRLRARKADVDAYMASHRVEPKVKPAGPTSLREALSRIAEDTLAKRRRSA